MVLLPELFRDAALGCRDDSPVNYELLSAAADDLAAGGVTAQVMAGCESDRGTTVPALRFAGAVHRLVLEGKVPTVAKHYRTAGGSPRPGQIWDDVEPALRKYLPELRQRVRMSQTRANEPGRNAPLYGGLLVASQWAARAAGREGAFIVRLLEAGAGAGLNLRPERIAYPLPDGTVLGDPDSSVRIDPRWTGLPPADLTEPVRIAQRAGCDEEPIDPGTREGELRLCSSIWPDQVERGRQLSQTIALAAADGVRVDQAAGGDWLAAKLSQPRKGMLTVVWHVVSWQNIRHGERARGMAVIAEAARRSDHEAPLALLVYDPRRVPGHHEPHRYDLLLRLWPADIALRLGYGHGHGVPFTWDPGAQDKVRTLLTEPGG